METRLPARSHRLALAATFALVVAACSSGGTSTLAPSTAAPSVEGSGEATASGPVAFSPELLGAPEVTDLKIGTGTVEANNMFPQFAVDAGIFEKYGLNVEVLPFDGAEKALQAAVAGQVNAVVDSPQITFTSMTTEAPLQGVATFTNKFLDCIVTKPDITDADTLRGKKIAVSSLGGQSHAEVLISLKSLGLTDADVQVTQVGGQGDRVAALQAGSVDAIPVDCATADALASEGFSTLLRLPELDIPFAGGGVQFKREFIEANPNTVLAVVAAHLEAMQAIYTDEQAAIDSFAAWGQVDEAEAKTQIDFFKEVAQRDLRWTNEGLKNAQDIQVLANPEVANIDLNEAADPQFLDRLKELGLNEQLDVPSN